MKVAFFVNWFPNLSETFILNQLTGLLDRGCKVDVFAIGPAAQPMIHADVEKYNLTDCTFYHGSAYHIMPRNKLLRFTKAVGLLITNLPKKPLPLFKSLNVFRFGAIAASLTLFFKAITFLNWDIDQYDIIHCHFGPNGRSAAWLKDVGAIRGKVITTFHGYDISNYLDDKNHSVYGHLFETGDLFLPISERWKKELVKLGCKENKIVVHRMGVDTSKFLFSPRAPGEGGNVHILTVARLVEKKGIRYGIEAVAKVLEKYPKIEYKIVGDGPLKADLENLTDTLDVNDKIKFLGWKQQEEIIALMQQADILLAPSVTAADGDQEGIPVVLMEALAQGLPVLSTQHSGIPELVQDGLSGFLVAERDVTALAEKLERFIQHPELWPEMGKAGRAWVEKCYDIDKLNDELVILYRRLLAEEKSTIG